jgi:hypothetical protein
MHVECTDNGGFEDQLSNDRLYRVKEFKGASVQIENDLSQVRWYGLSKFKIPGVSL